MAEELYEDEELMEEYESSFDSEEKLSNSLKLSRENFTIDVGVIDFDDLLIPDPVKNGRKETYLGLSTSVAEMGIVTPIHVMLSESYAESEDGEGSFKYILLDGFRRVWSGYKNGLKRCNAVIWDFKNKEKGSELAPVLSMMLNKVQRRSWGEVWHLLGILEAKSNLTPGTLEYLLQLESGDAMKLKDIMLSDYSDVKDDLLSNKKTISQCYNLLQKYRKEEDKLLKDDMTGIATVEEAEGVVEKDEGDRVLSDSEVKELLEMDEDSSDLSEDDFDDSLVDDDEYYDRQTVGDRHPLDRALKAETMLRDNYQCQCCGSGEGMSMMCRMAILQSHHKISVANSGPDSKDNIITLCMTCHTLVHVYLKNGMKFGISKEQFDAMPDHVKEQFKNIRALAKIDWEAGKRLGKNKDDMRRDNAQYMKFKMPGTDLAENREALKEYNERKSNGSL